MRAFTSFVRKLVTLPSALAPWKLYWVSTGVLASEVLQPQLLNAGCITTYIAAHPSCLP